MNEKVSEILRFYLDNYPDETIEAQFSYLELYCKDKPELFENLLKSAINDMIQELYHTIKTGEVPKFGGIAQELP